MIRGNVKIVTELLSPWRRGRGCGSAVGILDQLSRFRRRIRASHSTGGPRYPRSPVTAPQAGTVDPPARALALRGVGLMLVCAGLFVLSGQVLAQTAYVSNTGQTVGIDYRADVNFKQAQQFTTGSQVGGYTLGRVGVVVSTSPSTTGLTVAIYSSSGDNNPDALLHTLTNPSSLTDDTEALFTPSSTVTLAASTSYFIVVAKTGTVLQLCSTRSDADDAGGSAGWSIANSRREESGGFWGVGDDALKISIYPPSNNNTATGKPAITGTPQVGQTLTAGIGTIADADGLTTRTFPGDYTFQWIRVAGGTETDIGSDQNTYTPVAADVGGTIKVQVDFTDDLVNNESRTSAAYPSSGSILAAKSACPADATGGTGWCATMTVGTTDETSGGDRIQSYGFKFKVGVGSLIERFFTHAGTDYEVARVRRVLTTRSGSVDSDYMTLWTDKAVPDGTLLKVDGRTAAFTIGPDSDDTEAVGAEQWDLETLGNPPNWVEGQKVTVSLNFPPTLSASAAPGMTLVLTYDETLDDTSVPAASAYAVTVDGSDRTVSSVAISGQTVTLTLASAVTLGQTVIVSYTVPGTNPVQDDEVVTSVNNVATGAPTITGTPQVGQTLTAGIGTIADDNGLPTTFPNDYIFQWIRVDGGTETDISRATQDIYRLVAADEGKQIKVKVSFTDDHDYDESRTSTAYPARGYPSSAIAIVAAKSACPTGNNWCETMEVGYATQGGHTYYGFDDRSSLGSPGTLTSTSIRDGATTYTVRHIIIREPPAAFQAHFSAYLPRSTVLNVGGAAFHLNAESEDSTPGSYTWSIPSGFSMVENQEMTVSLNFMPTLNTATVDGTALVLTYDEDLDDSSVPAASAYSVKVDGGAGTAPSSVAISGKTVILTLATAVTSGQTVTVSYTVPGTNPVQDDDGIDAAALIDEAVTNNTGNTATTGAPTILGTPQVGNTLTAKQGTIADGNGLPTTFPDDYTFQWVRVDADNTETDIGSDQNTYMLVAADVGSTIKVTVRFTDGEGFLAGPLASIPTQAVRAEQEDCATDRPDADWCTTITVGTEIYTTLSRLGIRPHSTFYGVGSVGSILDPVIKPKFSVRHLGIIEFAPESGESRDGVTFRTNEEEWLPSGTIFNFGGEEFAASRWSRGAIVGIYAWDRPANFSWVEGQKVTVSANISGATGAPEVLGTPQVGKTLKAKIGTIADSDGLPTFPDDFTFQWVRVDGRTETDISGATSDTYTLTAADEGKKVKVEVYFTDDSGSDEGPLNSGAIPQGSSTIASASADDPDGEVLLHTSLVVDEYTGGVRNIYTKWGCSGDSFCNSGMGSNTLQSTGDGDLERSFKITALTLTHTTTNRYILGLDFQTTRLSNYELANLVLELDDRKYRFDGADASGCHGQSWHDVVERWDDGDVIQVRILDRGGEAQGNRCKPRATVHSTRGYEGPNANLRFVVTMHSAPSTEVTVDYQTSSGSSEDDEIDRRFAKAGEDYEATSGRLTFARGETRKTILVPIIDDSVNDPFEHMYLTLKNASPGVEVYANDGELKSTATVAGYIFNSEDDPTPELSVRDTEATEGADRSLGFVVTMTPEMPVPVEVDYATSDGTATAPDDYTSTSGTLTFAAGETTKRVSVTITPDQVAEDGGETVNFTLSNASGADAVLGNSTAVGTIWDALTAEFQQVPASHDGTNAFTFRIAFSQDLASGMKSGLETSLSLSGADLKEILSVDDRSDLFEVTLEPTGDDVTLSLGPSPTDCTADGAICTSDDTALTGTASATVAGPTSIGLSVADAAATEGTDTSLDFVVTLSPAAAETVTVNYATSDGSATDGSDYTAASGTLTFAVGETEKTVSVFIDEDSVEEGRETVNFTLSGASGAAIDDGVAVGRIRDPHDPLTAEFQQVPASHDGTNMFTFRVSFSEALAQGMKAGLRQSLSVSGANVKTILRVDDRLDLFEVTLEPKGDDDVILSLSPSTTDCTSRNAVCNDNDVPLSGTITATVPGPSSETDTTVVEKSNSPATGAPTISGTAQVGQTLTASTSGIADDDGLTDVSYTYQWIRNDGTDDADNDEELTSAATGTVAARPNRAASGTPTISGTAQVDSTLTASVSGISDDDGLTGVSYSYQWIRNDGTDAADISGATSGTYTLVDADQGKTIKVKVSFTDDAGHSETLTSAATGTVAARPNRAASGSPTITGTAKVGQTLTASTTGITDADGLTNVSYTYQWIRNDGTDDDDISGATSGTYTLVDADQGKTIKVKVSFTDDAGYSETLTSAATGTVVARPNRAASGSAHHQRYSEGGADADCEHDGDIGR